MTVATGTLLGRYRIISPLGAGGMGEVYLAEDTQLSRRVALKFPTVKSSEQHTHARFLREARAVSTLSHPHIATIYDYGETDEGHPFIIMELIRGESLNDLLQKGALSLARAVEIIADVADALAEAHAHGVIHRDIKPSNVMINERGDVKVLDFGLAKMMSTDPLREVDHEAETVLETHTQSGVVVGTPLYLSPEQATGDQVDARSDIFALGALLYECITGRPAFSGKNTIEIVAQVIHVAPPAPSSINQHIPAELERVTLKALAKEPAERYQSAIEFRTDLVAISAQLTDAEHHVTQRIRRTPKTQRASALTTLSDLMRRPRLSFLTVLIIAALAVLLFGIYTYWRRQTLHQPSVEAQRWYDLGTSALRDGAYFQASKLLERAINADNKFALAHARYAEALMELDYIDKAKNELLEVSRDVPDRSLLPQLDQLRLDAIIATAQRDFTSAIKSYTEIARLTPNQADAYVDLGRSYENAEDLKAAIENYLKATTLDPQSPTAFLRVAILYGRRKDTASANAAFQKADDLYQLQGRVEGSAQVHYQRGNMLRDGGSIPDAHAESQKSLDLARTLHYESQEILSLLQLSNIYVKEGDTGQAEQIAHDAVELAQTRGMENLTVRGLIDLGGAFFGSGNLTEAEKYYRQALDAAHRYNGRSYGARALLALGSLLIQKGATDEGLSDVEGALDFFKTGGYRTQVSQCLTLIGRAKRHKGDYDGAIQSFEQVLQSATEVGDQSQIASANGEIGNLLAIQQRFPEALKYYRDKYAIGKSVGDQKTMNYSLLNQGEVLWQLGRYSEAEEVFDQVTRFASAPKGGDQALLAGVYLAKGMIALSKRDFAEAKTMAHQALATLSNPNKALEINAKLTLGLAATFAGEKRDGKQLCEEAASLATQSGDPTLISEASLALAETMYQDGDFGHAQELALQAQGMFERAGQTASEWRALLLLALANRNAGEEEKARDYAQRAADLLASLQQKWDAQSFSDYLARPDVQFLRKQLSQFTELK